MRRRGDGGVDRRAVCVRKSGRVRLEAAVDRVERVVNRGVQDGEGPRLPHRVRSLCRLERVDGDGVPVRDGVAARFCGSIGDLGVLGTALDGERQREAGERDDP